VSEAFIITGNSMRDTILSGDLFMNDRLTPRLRNLRRGEIVAYRSSEPPNLVFCARVIAVGGDDVELRNEQLSVNGKVVEEPYARWAGDAPHGYDMANDGPHQVPEGFVYILGDNRRSANDSRFHGLVSVQDVEGIARCIFWSRELTISGPVPTQAGWDHIETWGAVRWSRIGLRLDRN
jgi:signal peptidase I